MALRNRVHAKSRLCPCTNIKAQCFRSAFPLSHPSSPDALWANFNQHISSLRAVSRRAQRIPKAGDNPFRFVGSNPAIMSMNLGFVNSDRGISRGASKQLGYANRRPSRSTYDARVNMNPTGVVAFQAMGGGNEGTHKPSRGEGGGSVFNNGKTRGSSRRNRGAAATWASAPANHEPKDTGRVTFAKHNSTVLQQAVDELTKRLGKLERRVEKQATQLDQADQDVEMLFGVIRSLSGGVPWRYAKAADQILLFSKKKDAYRGEAKKAAAIVDKETWILVTDFFDANASEESEPSSKSRRHGKRKKDEYRVGQLYLVHEVSQKDGTTEVLYATHRNPKTGDEHFETFAVFPSDDAANGEDADEADEEEDDADTPGEAPPGAQ